ncbi:hypothetical protein ID866_9323 [Astraeus odoratus]|nr:hypothetical protein ID866_9323 [Astraeus odoratus]
MLSRFAKLFCAIVFTLLILATLATLHPPTRAHFDPWTGNIWGEGGVEQGLRTSYPYGDSAGTQGFGQADVVSGGVIMSKLGNETAKAELGRATWKLLQVFYFSSMWYLLTQCVNRHTMTLRFPEHPTPDQREALSSYMHLTSRLYPCGECAAEFQQLLKKFPPQTSSRRAASLWLCSVHNEVNERLGKPIFDCAKLDETYDCGCGDAPTSTSVSLPSSTAPQEEKYDPMDLEWDQTRDEDTGVQLIKGGRR